MTGDPAPTAVERFAPDAFAGVVGQVVPMRLARGVGHWVRITVADVAEDGSSATLRLEPADGPDD